MKIKIKVTKDVLEKTANCDGKYVSKNCAVAYAVREILPNAIVDNAVIFIGITNYDEYYMVGLAELKHKFIHIDLPFAAIDFIDYFDILSPEDRVTMHPISFEIDVPSEVIEKIGIGEVYRILSESKTLEHVPQ